MLPLIITLWCLGPTVPSQEFKPDFQWNVIASTVRLHDTDRTRFGSGVVVGSKGNQFYILTADHILSNIPFLVDTFDAASYPKEKLVDLRVEIVCRDRDADLALLRVTIPEDAPKISRVPGGTKIHATKFAWSVLTVGCTSGLSPTCRLDVVREKKLVFRGEEPVAFFWETQRESTPGRSGGGLFLKDGRLVGICSARQNGLGYYAHLDEIVSFLKKNAFDWLLNPGSDTIP